MQLQYKKLGIVKKYILLHEERTQFNGIKNENFSEAQIEVECLESVNNMPCFKVSMKNFKQSNTEGMYKWVGDLHTLRKEVIFTLNEQGQIGEVQNLNSITYNWPWIRQDIRKQHAKEKYAEMIEKGIEKVLQNNKQFSSTLRFTMPYLLLFSGINNKEFKENESAIGYRELPNFLNVKKVPIITTEKITNIDSEKKQFLIEVEGKIDEMEFEQDKISRLIKILKNRPRVPTLVQLKYTEKHLLDQDHWPLQSMCLSLAYIPGTLYREEKTILKLM